MFPKNRVAVCLCRKKKKPFSKRNERRVTIMKRLLFSAGAAMTAAMLVGQILGLDFPMIIAGTAMLCAALILVFFLCFRKEKISILAPAAVLLLFAALGALRWGTAELEYNKGIDLYNNKTVKLDLTIIDLPPSSDTVWMTAAVTDNENKLFSGKVSVPNFGILNLSVGDRLCGQFHLTVPSETVRKNKQAEGILFTAVLLTDKDYDIIRTAKTPVSAYFSLFRQEIRNRFLYYLGKEAGFACGLMTGDTSGLPEEDLEALRRAGLLHITAVSGLHVSMLCSMIGFLLQPIKSRWKKAVLCGGCVLLLCGVSGFSPSAVRAALMAGFSFLPACYAGMKVRYEPLNGLGFAACIILTVNPFAVGSASFLLSFCATLGILILAGPIEGKLSTFVFRVFSLIPGKAMQAVIRCFSTSAGCFVFSAPATLLLFGTVTPAGVLSNLLLFFLLPFVFVCCAILFIFSEIPGFDFLCRALAVPIQIGVNTIMDSAGWISALAFSSFSIEENKKYIILILLILSLAAICVMIYGKKVRKKAQKKKTAIFSGITATASAIVLAFVFLISVSSRTESGNSDRLQIAFLNVGQGSCIVVTYEDTTVLYDCGGSATPANTAGNWLRKNQIDDIDYLILSHLHDDHANGVAALCEKYPVGQILIPAAKGEAETEAQVQNAADKRNIPILELSEDFTISSGNALFTLMTRHIDPGSSDQNENCIVLKIEQEQFTALLTGDITATAEKRILDSYGEFQVDLFSVPHHGSQHSSSEEFLYRITPTVSVISVGEGNTYGHPADEVVSRLLSYGKVYMTKDAGTVIASSDGKTFSVTTEK